MKVPFVDLQAQYRSMKKEIDQSLKDVISESAFIGGKYVRRFEEEFAAFCGADFCVGVGNGTDALYITLRALGIGSGDEVITVANSFIATAEAISLTGARVVFVDCNPLTYNIDIKKVPNQITPRTKAIVPVHLYGQPAEMAALQRIALEHGLSLIEDAAQAHGAQIGDKRAGTFGDAACFSFYPGKNLGAYGDGGAIVSNNKVLIEKCRVIANHGRIQKYDHAIEGVNSRLDGIQAAILSAKLRHLEEWTEKRRVSAELYHSYLKETPVIVPKEQTGVRHVYHLFVVRVPKRDKVQAALNEFGISSGVHYPIALPNLQAYRKLKHSPQEFPIATEYSGQILSLPMYPEITEEQISYVCEKLTRVMASN